MATTRSICEKFTEKARSAGTYISTKFQQYCQDQLAKAEAELAKKGVSLDEDRFTECDLTRKIRMYQSFLGIRLSERQQTVKVFYDEKEILNDRIKKIKGNHNGMNYINWTERSWIDLPNLRSISNTTFALFQIDFFSNKTLFKDIRGLSESESYGLKFYFDEHHSKLDEAKARVKEALEKFSPAYQMTDENRWKVSFCTPTFKYQKGKKHRIETLKILKLLLEELAPDFCIPDSFIDYVAPKSKLGGFFDQSVQEHSHSPDGVGPADEKQSVRSDQVQGKSKIA